MEITVNIKPFTADEWDSVAVTAEQSTLLLVVVADNRIGIQIADDDGDDLSNQYNVIIPTSQAFETIARFAMERGWMDDVKGTFEIDLAQFDCFAMSAALQIAAFGKEIVA